ncbi:hypothetical protein JCM1841_006858 [Sporobolomyces salmonicolor]
MNSANHPNQYRAARFAHTELAIRTHARGLNSLDQITRFGLVEGVQLPATPGMSIGGQVVHVGGGNGRFKEGQHVCGLTYEGGLAEHCLLRQEHAFFFSPSGSRQVSSALS